MAGYAKQRSNWQDFPVTSTPILASNLNALETAIYNMKHNELDIRDFGATGDGTTDDSAAFNSAITEARASGGTILLPPPSGGYYRLTSGINLWGSQNVHFKGISGKSSSYGSTSALPPQVSINAAGVSEVFYSTFVAAGAITAGVTFENIAISGGVTGWRFTDVAGVRWINCSCAPEASASANNASVVLENFFWGWFDRCQLGANVAGENAVILRGKSGGLNASATYLIRFREVIFNIGCVAYEQSVATSTRAGHFDFLDCTSENVSTPFLTVTQSGTPGAWAMRGVAFRGCQHYDRSGGTDTILELNAANCTLQDVDMSSVSATRSVQLTAGGVQCLRIPDKAGRVVDGSAVLKGPSVVYKNDGLDITTSPAHDGTSTDMTADAGPGVRLAVSGEANARVGVDSDAIWLGAGGVTSGWDVKFYRQAADVGATDDDFAINLAGKGLRVKEGTNAKMGTAVLITGTKVVSTTAVTANSRILLTSQVDGGTPGFLRVSARTAGTSFTITSSSGTDTSTVAWMLVEPA